MRGLPKVIHNLSSFFSFIAGLFILSVIGLTVADVALRNVIGKSIIGTVEISTILLVSIAFLGLSSAEIDNRHVYVNLIEMKVTNKIKLLFSFLRIVLFSVIGIIIIYGLFDYFWSSFERKEVTNGILRLVTWPTKLILFCSFLYYFFILIWKSIYEFFNLKNDID